MSPAIWKRVCSLVLLSFSIGELHAQCVGTWTDGDATALWNDANNWNTGGAGCVPGTETTNGDIATFDGGGNAPFTITQNANVFFGGVDLLNIEFSNQNYTIDGTNNINFRSGISSPPNPPSFFTVGNGVTININTPFTVGNGTALELDVGSSTLNFGNNVTILDGSVTSVNQGVANIVNFNGAGNTLEVAGGLGPTTTLVNKNTQPFATAGTVGSTMNVGMQTTLISSVLTNQNSGTIDGLGTTGSSMSFTQSVLDQSLVTISNTNSGTIGSTTGGAIGADMNFSTMSISGGTLSNTNSGSVGSSLPTTGTGASISLSNPVTLSGGTLTNTNSGAITGGVGATTTFGSTVSTSNPSTISNTNTSAVSGTSTTVGANMTFSNDVTFNGNGTSTITNENDGSVGSSTTTGTGALMTFTTAPIFTRNGTLTNLHSSTGSVTNSGSIGASTSITSAVTVPSGSSILNQSDGAVSDGGFGAELSFGNTVGISGTVSNTNQIDATTDGTGSIGANLIFNNTPTITGVTLNNENDGTVGSNVAGAVGAQMNFVSTAPSFGTNGKLTNINTGTVANAASIGAYITIPNAVTVPSGSTITNQGNGTVTAAGVGAKLNFANTFDITGAGIVFSINENIGSADGAGSNGALLIFNATPTINNITPVNRNSGTIGSNVAGAIGAQTNFASTAPSFGTGGNFSNINSGSVANANSIGAYTTISNATTIPAGSAVSNSQTSGAITAGGIGASLSLSNALTLTGTGTFSNTASAGTVDGSGSIGALSQLTSISGATGSIFSNTNSMPITSGGVGTKISASSTLDTFGTFSNTNSNTVDGTNSVGSSITVSGAATLESGSTPSNTNNNFSITNGGTGALIEFSSTSSIGVGFTNLNLGPVSGTNSTGVEFIFGDDATLSNGVFLSNTNMITSPGSVSSAGTGASMSFGTSPIFPTSPSSATISNSNSTAVTGTSSQGAVISITNATTVPNGSMLNNTNSGAITDSGTGAAISSSALLTVDGSVSNTNSSSGTVNGTSTGALLEFGGATIDASGSLTNTNGAVIGSSVAGGTGAQVQLNGALMVTGTLTSTNNQTVDGVSSTGTLVNVSGASTLNASSTVSNENTAAIGSNVAGAVGAGMNFNGGITSIGGALTNNNTSSADGAGSIGTQMTIGTTNTVDIPTGGNLTNENSGIIGANAANAIGAQFQYSGSFTVEALITNTNSTAISNDSFGALFAPTSATGLLMTINSGGNVSNSNSGGISSGSSGAAFEPSGIILNSGGFLSNSNSGGVIGSGSLGASMTIANASSLNGGSVTINNSGGIFAGAVNEDAIGVDTVFENTVTIATALSNTNSSTATVNGAYAIGAYLEFDNTPTINGVTLTNENDGSVGASTGGAIGAEMNFVSTAPSFGTNGNLTNTNSSTASVNNSGSIGAYTMISSATTIPSGSTVTNENNGIIGSGSAGGVGAKMSFGNTVGITGALSSNTSLLNINQAASTADGPGTIGAYLLFNNTPTITSSTLTNENDGAVGSRLAGAIGAEMNFMSTAPSFGLNGNLTNANTGSVASSTGITTIGAYTTISNAVTVPAGSTITNESSGAITAGGYGAELSFGSTVDIFGTVSNTFQNSVAPQPITTATADGLNTIGAYLLFNNNTTIEDGVTLSNQNVGAVGSSFGGAVGAKMAFATNPIFATSTTSQLINTNIGNVSNIDTSSSTQSIGAWMTIANATTIGGAGFNNQNFSAITAGAIGAETIFSGTVNILSTVFNDNSSSVDGLNSPTIRSTGTYLLFENDTTINGSTGSLTNENDGTIGSNAGGAIGAQMFFATSPIFTNSGILLNTNDGPVSNVDPPTNTPSIGALTTITGATTVPLGAEINNTNTFSAITNGGIGAELSFGNTVNILGTVFNNNTSQPTVDGQNFTGANSIGAYLLFNGTPTINGSTLTNDNDGAVGATTGGAIGAKMNFVSTAPSFASNGNLTNINTSTATVDNSGSIGAYTTIANATTVPSGSTVTNENDGRIGSIAPGGVGAEIDLNNSLSLAGTILNTSTSTGTITQSTGSLFNITGTSTDTSSGASITNLNASSITSFGTGASMQIGGLITSGTLSNTNSSTGTVDASTGAKISVTNASTINPGATVANTNNAVITDGGKGATFTYLSSLNMQSNTSNLNTSLATVDGLGGVGAQFNFGGITTITGATLSSENDAPIGSTTGGASGVELLFTSGINLSNGTISSLNTGSVGVGTTGGGQSTGAIVTIGGGRFPTPLTVPSGSQVKIENSGVISPNSSSNIGASFQSGDLTVNGSFSSKNDLAGTVDGSGNIGTSVQAGSFRGGPASITINSGSFTNENDAPIGSISAGAFGASVTASDLQAMGGTFSSTNTGTVDGTGSMGTAVTLSGSSASSISSGATVSNINQGTIGSITAGGEGAVMDYTAGISSIGGTLNNTNSGMTDGASSIGSFLTIETSNIVDISSGGALNNSNSGTIGSVATGAVGSFLQFAGNFTVEGLLSNSNSGVVDNATSGALLQPTAAGLSITVNDGGSVTNTNTSSTINGGSKGADFDLNTNPGSILLHIGGSLQNTNTALLNGSSTNIGAYMNVANTSTFNAGSSMTNSNNASISNGNIGAQMVFGNILTINGTAFNTNATGATVSGANSIGASILFNTSLALGGSFTEQNNASISSGGIGTQTTIPTLSFSSGGNFMNNNTGNVTGSSSYGVNTSIGSPLMISANATLSNINSGSITNSGTGSFVDINGNLSVSGTLINRNTGLVDATSFGALITLGGSSTLSISSSGSVTNTFTTHPGALIQASAVNVNGGTLSNDDLIQSDAISVHSGGLLTGSGTLKGLSGPTTTVTNDSGVVFPATGGSTPATMTIDGNYVQGANGTLQVGITNPSVYSLLNITGTADLSGQISVDFINPSGLTAGTTFTVLDAAGGRSGTEFTSASSTNTPSSLMPMVTYPTPDTVVISFIPNMGPPVVPTTIGPETSYGGGFVQMLFNSTNSINSHLVLEMEKMRRKFKASKEENEFYASESRFDADRLIASNDDKILAYGPLAFLSPQTKEKQEQQRRELVNETKDRPWNVYIGPTGRTGSIQASKHQPKMDYWAVGGLAGFDYAFSQVGLGLLADYQRIDTHVKKGWGKIKIDEVEGSIYSTYAPSSCPQFAIDAIVGGGYEWVYLHRNTGTPTDKRVATATTHGFSADGLLGFEYQFFKKLEGFHIIPLANVQYIYLHVDGYKEHGAGKFDMKVGDQRAKSLRSALGLRMNYVYESKNIEFVPEIYGEWQREYLNKSRHLEFSAVAFDAFPSSNLLLPGSGRDIGLAGVDLLLTLYNRHGIEAQYEYEYNSQYQDNFFYLGYNVRF